MPWMKQSSSRYQQIRARASFDLPLDKKIILLGVLNATQDARKGFQYLTTALQSFATLTTDQDLLAVIFGASEPDNPPELGLPATYLGRLNDDAKLAQVYSAADVMVVPSVQEAFGKTATEALACGTPVVSFDTSGLRDIVEHQKCGYRAKCYSAEDLANGIAWVLQDPARLAKIISTSTRKSRAGIHSQTASRSLY